MPLINNFDPWRSGLCTCPSKLTFNPYTGCDHQCLYCYATNYIPNFKEIHPKKNCLTLLRQEATKLNGQTLSLSNSSDPYPQIETSKKLTRQCLEILTQYNCKIQIITKSNIVTRDNDLLSKIPTTVALTITTDNETIAQILEPNAPTPNNRIRAAQVLQKAGIPVSIRIDPLIPHLNDQPQKLIKTLADIGIKHITCSTYKAKPDNWNRLYHVLPKMMEQLKPLYFMNGEKIGGSTLLSSSYRYKLLKNIRETVLAQGMQFGICREALPGLSTAACDGSWLMPKWSD
ncbi:MAG: radical SAM protein [Nitrososphaerota archaeon]|jgi:DNA repair photolyase|nr:radical SAM protein [Nitrososphaerota archaeon]